MRSATSHPGHTSADTAEQLAGQAGRWTDRHMGLQARHLALLNLGLKGAIELPLLIVHLTQDHVVLQEEFVSHTKPGKRESKKETE